MMSHEPEERSSTDDGGTSTLDLPLLSRDDDTWERFQGADVVADTASRGDWEDDNTRALLWRLLLGVLPRTSPPSAWATEMARKREEYRRLKADHRMDIAKVLDTTDPMSANPLFSGSGSGDDPWSHFYERKEMTETIKADLERLFPTGCGDHFLAPARQELLLSVLSLWADLNTATSYRQGMHEVLAPLILALEKEAAAASRADPAGGTAATLRAEDADAATVTAAAAARASPWVYRSAVYGASADARTHPGAAATLGSGSTPEDLEADAFWLFSAVMDGLEGFYEHGTNASSARGSGKGGGSGGGGRGGRGEGDGVDSPVVEMCKRLQGPRMREADSELQRHLAGLDISPQLYGMKWARLMFGREFRVEAVMLLWDHIFASSWIEGRPNIPECIENVAVAMVVSIRDQLLSEDCTGCLQLLMRYPPDQSVKAVISQALATSSGRSSQPFASPAPAAASLVPRPAEAAATAGAGAPPFASQVEPSPAWLNRSGRDAGGMSGGHRSPPAPRRSAGVGHESDHRRGGGDAWMGQDGRGYGGGGEGGGGGQGLETERETKHNWQQGLDDFTRRALSAAQGVAKMAVQTVERSQGGGAARQRPGVAATEAFSYARRLRAACASMEAGDTSVSLAMQEIKEVARLLEERSQGGPTAGRSVSRDTGQRRVAHTNSGMGGGGGGRGVTRGFSTYSEDDGCADALYTQDL